MQSAIDYLVTHVLLQVLEGLHALNVAHGDIKPSNIVYQHNNHSPHDMSNIKLIDFGFAQLFSEGLYVYKVNLVHTINCLTFSMKNEIRGYSHGYSSPELLSTNTLALNDDIYSAGIIIGQLVSCSFYSMRW